MTPPCLPDRRPPCRVPSLPRENTSAPSCTHKAFHFPSTGRSGPHGASLCPQGSGRTGRSSYQAAGGKVKSAGLYQGCRASVGRSSYHLLDDLLSRGQVDTSFIHGPPSPVRISCSGLLLPLSSLVAINTPSYIGIQLTATHNTN